LLEYHQYLATAPSLDFVRELLMRDGTDPEYSGQYKKLSATSRCGRCAGCEELAPTGPTTRRHLTRLDFGRAKEQRIAWGDPLKRTKKFPSAASALNRCRGPCSCATCRSRSLDSAWRAASGTHSRSRASCRPGCTRRRRWRDSRGSRSRGSRGSCPEH
jgi:hypothetical protein